MPGGYANRSVAPGPAAAGRGGTSVGVRDLARALTEEERRRLLDQISRCLSLTSRPNNQIVHGELRKERLSELIEADKRSMSLWDRIRFWFKRLFGGQSDDEIFLSMRIAQMQEKVEHSGDDLVNFEHDVVLPELAKRAYQLYLAVYPIIPFFRSVWHHEDTLRHVVHAVVAQRVPNAKRKLNEFVSTQELQELYRSTESRNQLKQLVLDRIADYVESIHPDVLKEVQEGLMPVYLVRELGLFPYDDFFSHFQVSLVDPPTESLPNFHQAGSSRVIDDLEQLYLAVHNAQKAEVSNKVFADVLRFFEANRIGEDLEEGAPGEATDDESAGEGGETASSEILARDMQKSFFHLVVKLQEFSSRVPLTRLVRIFRNDPYYRFMAYVPKVRLKDFYYSNLKVTLLQVLDERFPDLRMGVVGKMIQEVFPRPLVGFEYFHPEIPAALKRLNVPGLQLYKTLQIIQNFIVQIYKPRLIEFLRAINRLLPTRGRRQVGDFGVFVAGYDDIAERLRIFDSMFSPESDDGKTFYRYRYAGERDSGQLTALKSFVVQLDREARTIVERFNDTSRGVYQGFKAVRDAGYGQINERYAPFEPTSASQTPFDDRIDEYLKTLETIEKIVGQMVANDQGM